MLNWQQSKKNIRWTLSGKIGALATLLLLLLGGVSTYFYFEINEISREIEEIGQSDIPIYKTTNELIAYQKERRLLLKEIDHIHYYISQKESILIYDISHRINRLNQNIDSTLSQGIKQAEFAIQSEYEKEDNMRLNQAQEDYRRLQNIFLELQLKNKDLNQSIERILKSEIMQMEAPTETLIKAASDELQSFDELTHEILQRLEGHIDGSVSAISDERALAVKHNLLITIGALLLGSLFSTLVNQNITDSVNKVTRQAKFIADNIDQEDFQANALVVETTDEIRDLSVAFNHMVKSFLDSQAERNKMAEKVLLEKELVEWQANHDSLTGLFNRREFEHQLFDIWNHTPHHIHALLYLDLDHFKVVNDTCGHRAGDELLRQVTQLMSSHIRGSDILARLGGDEFGVILNGCPLENAVILAQKILQSIQQYNFIWQGQQFTIGVSIGVVSFCPNKDNLNSVLSAADAACYKAKEKGRNQIFAMQDKQQELVQKYQEMNWLSEIRYALKEDRFLLYYQAIQPLQTDSSGTDHYEVLLRIEGRDGQIIAPMAFIPVAERYQLMHEIDRWVIRTLFATQGHSYRKRARQAQANEQTLHSFYTINLSGETVNDTTFIEFVRDALDRYQIPPQLICFEITETVAISNLPQAQWMINQLKAIGCRFALDDFGSGMSSFGYLKNLPVDFLKIDGTFIREFLEEPVNRLIVQSFHQVAQGMGIDTIAEFVDSEEKRDQLQSLGIDYAQGSWIATPQPLTTLKLLTANHNAA